jgi:hypothetical protein
VSEENFWQTMDAWETPGREATPPMFGWLSTELPAFAEPTLDLRTLVHIQSVGCGPYVEVEPTDHPLALEQREAPAGLTRPAAHRTSRRVRDFDLCTADHTLLPNKCQAALGYCSATCSWPAGRRRLGRTSTPRP